MNYIKHKKGGVCTHAFFVLPLRGYFVMFKISIFENQVLKVTLPQSSVRVLMSCLRRFR